MELLVIMTLNYRDNPAANVNDKADVFVLISAIIGLPTLESKHARHYTL